MIAFCFVVPQTGGGTLESSARAAASTSRGTSAGDQARKILRNHRYQTVLPALHSAWEFPLKTLVTTRWMIALGLVIVALVFGSALVRRLRSIDEELPARGREAIVAARPRRAAEQIADAERLAAEGRYSEAAHRLLLVAIERLGRSEGSATRSAHTSREILRSLPSAVPEESRSALNDLVRYVEISWFGGRELAEAEFASCLRSCLVIAGEPT